MINNIVEWAEQLIKPADVVVVSGDTQTRCSLCGNLSQLNCVVSAISDGITAIEYFKKRKPDVMMIDLSLAKKSAFHVIQSVRKLYGELPIVVLLNGEPEIPSWLAQIGHVTLMKKPRDIQVDRLKNMLQMFKSDKRAVLTRKCKDCKSENYGST